MRARITQLIGMILLTSIYASHSHAAVITKEIEYKDGETTLKGFLAYDDTVTTSAPGVLICHQWMGLSDHERDTARALAAQGYIAFACDIYGVEHRPRDRQAASQIAGRFKNDTHSLRRRANLGLQQLQGNERVDAARMAVIGFCFGGTTALELARSGARLAGTVSIHGGLGSDNPSDANNIKGRVLVLHGADDPYVPDDEVRAFTQEMRNADVSWQMISYGDAVHSFTHQSAGNDPSTGAAYNKHAAASAWQHMLVFFHEVFNESAKQLSKKNPWVS